MAKRVSEHEALPKSVTPTHYSLWLKPDLEAATFAGRVSIKLDINEGTDTIVLNAAEMTVSKASLRYVGREAFPATSITLDKKTEQLTLVFPKRFLTGTRAVLDLEFSGTLNDRMIGFYRSSYQRADKSTSWMATTQFEPYHARRAFPCWDEPGRKAKFQVTIVAPVALAVISNTPVREESREAGLKVVSFEETPLMSTYLLAFVIGELEEISDRTEDGVELRFWARPGQAEKCRFALDVTKKALGYYAQYFGVPYSRALRILNQIAIPDFSAGAMENWGCITYREIALLADESTSLATRIQIAITVTHELAHQWFGNLVTMKWWNDLWLNESFATWMATKVLNHFFPEWKLWPRFVYEEMAYAMELDAQASTHPIEVPIPRAFDVEAIFDAISYSKGGCILRMLELWLGEEGFREGLRLYMKRHAYGNAEAADLWNALGEANSGKPVASVMSAWTSKPGFPVVKCSYESSRRHGSNLYLSQRRFCLTPGTPDDVWPIPLNDGRGGFLMEADSMDRELNSSQLAVGQHLNVNPGRAAYCRVTYDRTLLGRLVEALRTGQLGSVEERFALQDDAAALAFTGQAPATDLFELAPAYADEPEESVWSGLLDGIGQAVHLLKWDPAVGDDIGDAYILRLIDRALARLGWDAIPGESSGDVQLRGRVLGMAIAHRHPEVIQEALRRFRSGGAIDPNLRGAVYGAVARHGGPEGYEQLLARYRAAEGSEEKVRLLAALGRTTDLDLKRRTLEFALSPEVRLQDMLYGIRGVMNNAEGIRLAWNFLKEHWAEICKRLEGNNAKIGYYVKMAGSLATREDLADASAFLTAHPTDGLDMVYRQALEAIEINIRWREANAEALAQWLTAH